MNIKRLTLSFLTILLTTTAMAEDVRIVFWNAKTVFDVYNAVQRKEDFKKFSTETKPDVLLIDEVCSIEVVETIRDAMGLNKYHVACSDFAQNDSEKYLAFEVGIISKYPLTKVIEYDPSPDNISWDSRKREPDEIKLQVDNLLKIGLKNALPSRGFLWARIDALKLTVCLTHLKSSRGGRDTSNARKREFVAAAMANSVLEDIKTFPDYTMMVAGDMNVGETDTKKNGSNLLIDIDKKNLPGDRYDDTHAILSKGLIRGLKMTSLTLNIGETYDSDRFPNTGAIDCIYIIGKNSSKFSKATKTKSTFGSDHFSISTIFAK